MGNYRITNASQMSIHHSQGRLLGTSQSQLSITESYFVLLPRARFVANEGLDIYEHRVP
jgi:hypothetical protein